MPVAVCKTQEILVGEVAAPNLETADVERAPVQTKRFPGVHLHGHGG